MNILHDGFGPDRRPTRVCLVFGAGLIGGRVIVGLRHSGLRHCELQPFCWSPGDNRDQQMASIAARIDALLDTGAIAGVVPQRMAVLWSAGHGGFASSVGELAAETRSFQQVIALTERLSASHPSVATSFHMLSSAGGLFEGQSNVGPTSSARPRRPYGHAKLEQEAIMNAWDTRVVKHCYRPSSVYGVPHRGQRIGLIPTLLRNGMQRRVTRFTGSMDTVRDYVTADDVAQFIASKINGLATAGGVYTLVTAQPTTLYQLKLAAERCIRHTIYAHFELNPTNATNISFLGLSSSLPPGWRPNCVATGLRKIHFELLQGGLRLAS